MIVPGRLVALLGAENVRTDADSRQGAVSAWSPLAAKAKQAGKLALPGVVAYPGDTEEVAALVRLAAETWTPLYPVGGASNVVQAVVPAPDGVAVDLSRLNSLTLDEESLFATVGTGMRLADLEDALNEAGYTLGQLPRSLRLLTVGGALATDAIGAFSGKYGRMRDRCAGLTVVLASGETLRTTPAPGANAAFDLHGLFIGSEGTLGIITEATLKIAPQPEARAWLAFTFPTLSDGIDALRLIYRTDSRPTMARVLDAEAASPISPGGRPLLLAAVEGDELAQTGIYQLAHGVCQAVGGTEVSSFVGDEWHRRWAESGGWERNARPDGLADVFAVSASWSAIKAVEREMRCAVSGLVTRLTVEIVHPTPHGAALELSWEAQGEPDDAPVLYAAIAEAGYGACLAAGGSVAHHLGVGKARRRFLDAERGPASVAAWQAVKAALDPLGILNP